MCAHGRLPPPNTHTHTESPPRMYGPPPAAGMWVCGAQVLILASVCFLLALVDLLTSGKPAEQADKDA